MKRYAVQLKAIASDNNSLWKGSLNVYYYGRNSRIVGSNYNWKDYNENGTRNIRTEDLTAFGFETEEEAKASPEFTTPQLDKFWKTTVSVVEVVR